MLRYGAQMDFAACFRMEHTLATNFLAGCPDFVEGVSAKLISKPARSPAWKPRLQEAEAALTPAAVKDFFVAK
jgi:3-hydroxyisobutyryl-CoA hydrolase